MRLRKTSLLQDGLWAFFMLFWLGGCAPQRTVLVTGFWPPTNEMIRELSDDLTENPGGWQGRNWEDSGYDVYAFFPEFPEGTEKEPWGKGNFEVDYQAARRDFERLTERLKPTVILCYGRGDGPWEIETRAVFREAWHNDYWPPQQPDWPEGFDYAKGAELALTLPAAEIERAVRSSVPGLKVWIDREGDPGGFICGYLAFLAADYQLRHPGKCQAAGFIHVGGNVELETAQRAHETTLRAVIAGIDDRLR